VTGRGVTGRGVTGRLPPVVPREFGLPELRLEQAVAGWGGHLRAVVRDATGRRLFLKERPFYLSGPEFEHSLRVQAAVSERDPGLVPAVLRTGKGRLCAVQPAGSRSFGLMELVDGGAALSARDSGTLARELARLHLALRAATPGLGRGQVRAGVRRRWFPDSAESIRWYVGHVLGTLRRDLIPPAGWAAVRHWLERQEPVPVPEPQWIHGDAAPGNVLQSATGKLTWIDFDDTRIGSPEWEVARAGALAGGYRDGTAALRDTWDVERVRELTGGYRACAPLDPDRVAALLPWALLASWPSQTDLDDLDQPVPDRAQLHEDLARLVRLLATGVRLD
jgi:Ser/Thr protein kinase RdoA (MazF antagonist)